MRLRYLLLKWRAQAGLVLGLRQFALDAFDEMLALRPGDAYALASRAHASAQAGDRAAAIADYRALLIVTADHPSAWFNLGFLLEQQGELDEARAALERAVELDPKLDRAWYGLALVAIRQRRFDDAVVALERNTKLQPMSPHGWYQLARVQVDRHQPEEAVKIIRHLQGFEPKVAAQLERETGLLLTPRSVG
ncbi:MAG: tetratricopeptide repeat protein [Methylibium sp.]|nr:tetratricopeptide repeat protein [Methylibium sp.]